MAERMTRERLEELVEQHGSFAEIARAHEDLSYDALRAVAARLKVRSTWDRKRAAKEGSNYFPDARLRLMPQWITDALVATNLNMSKAAKLLSENPNRKATRGAIWARVKRDPTILSNARVKLAKP